MNKFRNKMLSFGLMSHDEKAFMKMYDLYAEKIYRFIYFKISNAQEAEDLTSEVFLKAWQYIKDGKEIKAVNSFIYTIARNRIIDHYRKNIKAKIVDMEDSELENLRFFSDSSPGEKIDQALGFERLMEFLNKLKGEYKEALLLRYVDDYSISEISEILGKTKGNVRVLLHRAMEALREVMEEKP